MQVVSLLSLKVSNYSARIAGGDGTCRDVVSDNAAGTYHAIVANGNTGAHRDVAAKPHVVAHSDG